MRRLIGSALFLMALSVATPAAAVGVGEVDVDLAGSDVGWASPRAFRAGLRVGEKVRLVVIDITPEGGVRYDFSRLDWSGLSLLGGMRVHASLPISPGVYGNAGWHPAGHATWFAYGLGLDGRVDRALAVGLRAGFEHQGQARVLVLGLHLTVARAT